jgi:hypothetical protein
MHNHEGKHCSKGHCAGLVAGIVFVLIAVLHIVRIALGWTVVINGHEMPMWCNIVGIVVPGLLGAWLLCCACCKKCKDKTCQDKTCTTNHK